MAKLGIFQHAGIARLQQVDTGKEFRRQGLATALVSFAIDHAINRLGTAGLALAADRDYYAIDLYRRLGFVEAGFGATLMKYPIKNPAFMQP
jgi:ribosomal protein S18 acetylase RimI-like enzyme